jgi:hypothetical protein
MEFSAENMAMLEDVVDYSHDPLEGDIIWAETIVSREAAHAEEFYASPGDRCWVSADFRIVSGPMSKPFPFPGTSISPSFSIPLGEIWVLVRSRAFSMRSLFCDDHQSQPRSIHAVYPLSSWVEVPLAQDIWESEGRGRPDGLLGSLPRVFSDGEN